MKGMAKAYVWSEDRTKRAAETNKEKQETLRNMRDKYRENKAAVTGKQERLLSWPPFHHCAR